VNKYSLSFHFTVIIIAINLYSPKNILVTNRQKLTGTRTFALSCIIMHTSQWLNETIRTVYIVHNLVTLWVLWHASEKRTSSWRCIQFSPMCLLSHFAVLCHNVIYTVSQKHIQNVWDVYFATKCRCCFIKVIDCIVLYFVFLYIVQLHFVSFFMREIFKI